MNQNFPISSPNRPIITILFLTIILLLAACSGDAESVEDSSTDIAAPISEDSLVDTASDAPTRVDAEARSGDQSAGIAVRPIESVGVQSDTQVTEAKPVPEVAASEEPVVVTADDPTEVAEADIPAADSPPPDEPTPAPAPADPESEVIEGAVVADPESEVVNTTTDESDIVVRTGSVDIDFGVVAAADPLDGDGINAVALTLFDDVTLTAIFDRAEAGLKGSEAWSGVIDGVPFSDVVFVFNGDGETMVANINAPGVGHYRIRSDGEGGHFVEEVNPALAPEEKPPMEPPTDAQPEPVSAGDTASPSPATDMPISAAAPGDGPVIDVLVVYTPLARSQAGGTANIESSIQAEIVTANAGYANSGIDQVLRLVGMSEVAYTESAGGSGWSTMLNDLTFTGDGKLEEVHTMRNALGADLVMMVIHEPTYCGLGWLLNGNSLYGFSLMYGVPCFGGNTFAHELGHNMGATHDKKTSCGSMTTDCYSGQWYDYSFGYWFYGGSLSTENFRTIMSYNQCPTYCYRINYWSNPDVIDTGFTNQPMGIAEGIAGQADNRKSLNGTAATVAAFRAEAVYDCVAATGIDQTQCEALVALYDATGGDLWTDNTGWSDSSTPCTWEGVTCNLTNVTGLALGTNNLTNTLPSEINALTALITLDLGGNKLSGTLPDMSALTALTTLDLSNNAFPGEVPATFTGLTALTTLDIGYNALNPTGAAVAFLDAKDPDWTNTQTIAPSDLGAASGGTSSIDLSWTPTTYTDDGGSYEISYATNPAGPFTVAGNTTDKTVTSYSVTGLQADKTYYLRLRTLTPAHGLQLNALSSDYTATVSASTDPIVTKPSAITSINTQLLGSGPYRMLVIVKGTFTLRCGGRVDISDTLNGTDIEITFVKTLNPSRACSASAMKFTHAFILSDTYSGMTYNILINGVNVGSVNVP